MYRIKSLSRWLFLVGLPYWLFSTASIGQTDSKQPQARIPFAARIDAISSEWAADWSQKKLEAVMALYAPQPVFLPAVGPRWTGTDTIRKNFADLLAKYNPHIELHSVDSQVSDYLAYDSGSFDETLQPVKEGKPIHAEGNYLFVFQLQADGHWKILEQAWTSLEPVNL